MAWTVAIGVDTHKDVHVAVALSPLGAELGHCAIGTTSAGYKQLACWAAGLGDPAFVIEGCGSFGAGLRRFLEAGGYLVYECERPRRADRRRGKSDLIDAALAARRLLAGAGLSTPRGGGEEREQLRLLLFERRGAVQARTAALNQLHAAIVTAPDALRQRLAAIPPRRLAKDTAQLRPSPDGVNDVLRRIAQRAETISREIDEIGTTLATLIGKLAPQLLTETGVGAITAAQLLVSSGNPQRMRSEAAFAALAGTSPVDASSGKQQRHRLNRGGDRHLNWALHVIALQRVRRHPQTAAYYQHLLATGKTPREAKRCIKRALARHFYHQLRELPQTPLTT